MARFKKLSCLHRLTCHLAGYKRKAFNLLVPSLWYQTSSKSGVNFLPSFEKLWIIKVNIVTMP